MKSLEILWNCRQKKNIKKNSLLNINKQPKITDVAYFTRFSHKFISFILFTKSYFCKNFSGLFIKIRCWENLNLRTTVIQLSFFHFGSITDHSNCSICKLMALAWVLLHTRIVLDTVGYSRDTVGLLWDYKTSLSNADPSLSGAFQAVEIADRLRY